MDAAGNGDADSGAVRAREGASGFSAEELAEAARALTPNARDLTSFC
jgi:hypothetical protein